MMLMSRCSSSKAEGRLSGIHSTECSPSNSPFVYRVVSTNKPKTYNSFVIMLFLWYGTLLSLTFLLFCGSPIAVVHDPLGLPLFLVTGVNLTPSNSDVDVSSYCWSV